MVSAIIFPPLTFSASAFFKTEKLFCLIVTLSAKENLFLFASVPAEIYVLPAPVTLYAKVPLPKLSSPLFVVTDFKWSASTVKEAISLMLTFCWLISLFEIVLPFIMLITPKLSLPPIPFVKVFLPFKFNVPRL